MKCIAYIICPALVALTVLTAGCNGSSGPDPAATQETREPDVLLLERLAIAYGALRDTEGARKPEHAHRYAQAAVDAIAGPRGRHGAAQAPPTGILPGDGEAAGDEPGLALRAYTAAPEGSPLRIAVDGRVIGSVVAWRTPREGYDAIDRAVAGYTSDGESIARLDGAMEQALAWALLALNTDDVVEARAHAGRGAGHARAARDAVRSARASVASREWRVANGE